MGDPFFVAAADESFRYRRRSLPTLTRATFQSRACERRFYFLAFFTSIPLVSCCPARYIPFFFSQTAATLQPRWRPSLPCVRVFAALGGGRGCRLSGDILPAAFAMKLGIRLN